MSEPTKKLPLSHFSDNVFSQYGEDGILAKIFELIGTTSRVCIEFGAWEGFRLSNTANLWTKGWKGVLIEGERDRCGQLRENVKKYNCLCVNAFVTRAGENSLEAILHRNKVAGEIDLLSIDIDGDDYYILKSLEHIRPRVIVCEYNPTIPPEIDLYADCGSYFGASLTAIARVAESKGYSLIAITDTNGIFVLKSLTSAFHEFETRFECIKLTKHLTYLATSFAGDFILCGPTPFGVGIPYAGRLNGPHQACASLGSWPRSVGTRILRRFKTLAKQVLRKNK